MFEEQVSIYRRNDLGEWSLVASGVECRGQPSTGSVQQTEPGRVAVATHWFQFRSGTDLRQDDGLKVTSSWSNARIGLRVLAEHAADWGEAGGLQVDAIDTFEFF